VVAPVSTQTIALEPAINTSVEELKACMNANIIALEESDRNPAHTKLHEVANTVSQDLLDMADQVSLFISQGQKDGTQLRLKQKAFDLREVARAAGGFVLYQAQQITKHPAFKFLNNKAQQKFCMSFGQLDQIYRAALRLSGLGSLAQNAVLH